MKEVLLGRGEGKCSQSVGPSYKQGRPEWELNETKGGGRSGEIQYKVVVEHVGGESEEWGKSPA